MNTSLKYFKISEFACKCGCGYDGVSLELTEKLDAAREEAGVPFMITSGCRCEKHNRLVGGAERSAHTKGLAADIAANGKNREIILNACKKYFKRIGIADSFIHVDTDEAKPSALWKY